MTEQESSLVSVIVPVYNVKPYLNEALDSVINQTYKNLEIILIDDGSTDGSGEICDEYAARDNRIIVIHQTNQGLSAARNVGLDIMQGSIVSFLDPDDAFCPNIIETMLKAMHKEEVDVVVCKYYKQYTEHKLDTKGREEPCITPGIYNRNTILQYIVDGKLNISVWNKLYKVSLWKTNRFPVGREYEDIISLPLFYRVNKTLILSDKLYLHRKRQGSITMAPTLHRFRDWLQSQKEYESFVENNTPEIYSEKQLHDRRQKRISGMIAFYIRFIKNKTDLMEIKTVRKEILENSKGVLIRKAYIWCAYQLICVCPFFLSFFLFYICFFREEIINK